MTQPPTRCARCLHGPELEALVSYHTLGVALRCNECLTTYLCQRKPDSVVFDVWPFLLMCAECSKAMKVHWIDTEFVAFETLAWLECHGEHTLAMISALLLTRMLKSVGHVATSKEIHFFTDAQVDDATQEANRQAERFMHISKLLERFSHNDPPRKGDSF